MQNITHIKPGFFGRLKLIYDFSRNPIAVFENLQKHGDMVLLELFGSRQYVMFHPDMYHDVLVNEAEKFHKDAQYTSEEIGLAFFLGQGLLTSNGDFWKRQRKLAQPAFHTRRINAYAETMVEYTTKMLDGWQNGEIRDIDEEMMRVTLNIVAKTLFNAEIAEDAERIGRALTTLQHMFTEMDLFPAWWPKPKRRLYQQALDDLNDVVYRMMNERRKNGTIEDEGDLLSMLMLAEDENGERMSDRQVRDEAVTIILAGHETTANALNWTWYLLSQHPQIEAKLHDEIDSVLQGRVPTLADLRQLPYTEVVIKEAMRLYPPAYGISRWAIAEAEVGGYTIPAKSVANVLAYNVHRDSRWWDEPLAFRPERWESGEEPRHRYAYIPFGGGPRVCIGQSFAMMEACLLLATIAQRYRLSLAPGKRVIPEPLITLRPKNGLQMRLTERQPMPKAQPQMESALT
ncbi:MAG: cytochrome P450 [bacterium]|nr:cytochrome P450 [bacterium]